MNKILAIISSKQAVAYAQKISGVQGYGLPRRGSEGRLHRTAENCRKFAKNVLKKLQNA